MRPTVEDRFRDNIQHEPNTGCWLWGGALQGKGYGCFYFDGRTQAAHRVSWKLHNGTIPDGLHVLHRCDVPACVNPDHLFLGTNQDNVNDRQAKCRQARGHRAPKAKLTEEQVLAIRKDTSGTNQEIGARYGVRKQAVAFIKRGLAWGWLQDLRTKGDT